MSESKKTTLYEIVGAAARAHEILLENGGELTDEVVELLEQAEKIDDKADAYASVWRDLEAREAIVKGEAKRLRDRASSFSRAADALRDRLRDGLVALGRVGAGNGLKTARHTFSVSKLDPSVVVHDELALLTALPAVAVTTQRGTTKSKTASGRTFYATTVVVTLPDGVESDDALEVELSRGLSETRSVHTGKLREAIEAGSVPEAFATITDRYSLRVR